MSFSNISFAINCGNRTSEEVEVKWCYVLKHYYHNYNCESHYEGADLLSYKCDAERWTVDLRDAPLEEGQYIASIWANAFSWTNVTKVILPSTVEYIWDGAFCNAKKVWTGCWNWIIESWEECDDWDDNWYTKCNLNCMMINLPSCGNLVADPWETCGNCPEDIYCGKSIDWLGNVDAWEPELFLKWQISAAAPFIDNSNFVVVDFPDWMNDEFYIEDLDYACAKLQEYTITFMTEDKIVLWTWETFNQHIEPLGIPQAPQKEWFIWTWYLWDEIFDVNSQITGNITLVYKYEKWWIEYDEENWWIKVSLWDKEIIIKDKNQGSKKSLNEVDTWDFTDLIDVVWTYYLWWNNTWLNLKENLDDNGLVNLDEVILPEWFDHGYLWLEWWDDWTMWSNDTPCNVDSWEYLPSPDEWKNLMQIRWKINWHELFYYKWMYSFEDLSVLYPDLGKGGKSLNVFISAGPSAGGESSQALPGISSSNAIEKFLEDLYIWIIPPLYVGNWWIDFRPPSILFPASLSNWKIWYFTINWVLVYDESNLYWSENESATPVRCFVKPQFEVSFEVNGWTDVVTQKIFSWDNAVEPEVQKENSEFLWWFKEDGTKFYFTTPITSDITLYAKWQEKKSNSSYSGWGGWKSSSSNTAKTEDKVHNSADDKVTSKSEEKVKNNQIDIVNSKTQIEKKSDELSQKAVYHPDNTLTEEEQAYDFAHTYGITTKTSVESAKMDNSLTRIQMAKMLSQYAVNVLGKEPDVSKWVTRFSDVTNKMNKDYDNWVNLAYQLWIMWQNMKDNKFRPNDEVTRAEFVTALSRMLYNTSDWEYKSTPKYYIHHMQKLKSEWIITNDNPKMKEKRWYVMLMLLRSVK